MAIGISVSKGTKNESVSKFFGAPAVPAEWENDFDEKVIFFFQIKLSEIAKLDAEKRLPHTGYLYVFLDTSEFPYKPIVRISKTKPDMVIDDFNVIFEEFEPLNEEWSIMFGEAPDKGEGIKLFGEPNVWNSEEKPANMFMQFDPAATDMPLFKDINGLVYLCFDEDITEQKLYIERT